MRALETVSSDQEAADGGGGEGKYPYNEGFNTSGGGDGGGFKASTGGWGGREGWNGMDGRTLPPVVCAQSPAGTSGYMLAYPRYPPPPASSSRPTRTPFDFLPRRRYRRRRRRRRRPRLPPLLLFLLLHLRHPPRSSTAFSPSRPLPPLPAGPFTCHS